MPFEFARRMCEGIPSRSSPAVATDFTSLPRLLLSALPLPRRRRTPADLLLGWPIYASAARAHLPPPSPSASAPHAPLPLRATWEGSAIVLPPVMLQWMGGSRRKVYTVSFSDLPRLIRPFTTRLIPAAISLGNPA